VAFTFVGIILYMTETQNRRMRTLDNIRN